MEPSKMSSVEPSWLYKGHSKHIVVERRDIESDWQNHRSYNLYILVI